MKIITLRRKIAEAKIVGKAQSILRHPGTRIALGTAGHALIAIASFVLWIGILTALFQAMGLGAVVITVLLVILIDSLVRATKHVILNPVPA